MDIKAFITGSVEDYWGRFDRALEGLTSEALAWQPQDDCNPISFIAWHIYPDDAFDQSLALLVLILIPQPEKIASEMRRVTRPGGTVAACTWDGEGLAMTRMFWEEAMKLQRCVLRIRGNWGGREHLNLIVELPKV